MGWSDLPNLNKLPSMKQSTSVSCWAVCGSALSHYYYDTQGKGAKISEGGIASLAKGNLNSMGSIESVLVVLGCYKYIKDVEVDGSPLPTNDEIEQELAQGRPMVLGIGDKQLTKPKTQSLTGGHYMLLVGVDKQNDELKIMDPTSGKLETIKRGAKYTNNGDDRYYCKTFYTNVPK